MKKASRSYTLLEILLSLLIFAIAAWISLSLFAEGGRAANRAKVLENAPVAAANALERARSGDLDTVYYDRDWHRVGEKFFENNAGYYYRIQVTLTDGGFASVYATVSVQECERSGSFGRLRTSAETVYTLDDSWLKEEVVR